MSGLSLLAAAAVVALAPVAYPGPILLPATGAGVDISYPQCNSDPRNELLPDVPFAVIGVNGGRPGNLNPCFQSEYNSALLLAGQTEQPHASVYVNTANPSLGAAWWPTANVTEAGTAVTNPSGTCRHRPGPACAYVYGWSMAEFDYVTVSATLEKVPALWWLDVETTNSWQYNDVAANSAALSGMVDYFESRGLTVGIYSTSYQWKRIAGVTPATSSLAGLFSWLAGGSETGAPIDCELGALTPNGRVVLVQYVTHLDNDYSCRAFRTSATVLPDAPAVVGTQLSAVTGNWGGVGTIYRYQWERDGNPIPGATSGRYPTVAKDLGALITVTIGASAPGYSSSSVTSTPISVLGTIRPAAVRISGVFATGHTLTARTGRWKPRSVSLAYSWYRNGVLVSSGTGVATYVLSSIDVGHQISVTVTATDPGYAPTTVTATNYFPKPL